MEISPNNIILLPLAATSHATLLSGSPYKQASNILSLIMSHNLSGCPSPTLYDGNKKWFTGSV